MFLPIDPKNFHVQYANVQRHWSPRSEQFAGGDALLTAIERGWEFKETVMREVYWHGGSRGVAIYHFTLRKGDREIEMPVIENPYVTRLLYMSPLNVVDIEPVEQDEEAV